jgi:hypothetical protein
MGDSPRTTIKRGRGRHHREWLIVGGVLLVLAAVLAYAVRDVFRDEAGSATRRAKPQAEPVPVRVEKSVAKSEVVDDDGTTLWVSPTHGPPLDLAYLPPGVEIVLALRPQALLAKPEAGKIVAALGPVGAAAIERVERVAGTKLDGIERLLVAWRISRDAKFVATLVVTTKSPLAAAPDAFQPPREHGRVTVFAPAAALAEIRELDGREPPLTRDLERVLSHTDALRDATVVLRPQALLDDAHRGLRGEFAPLRRPLERFLGSNVAAASLSLNWDENFFVELVAVPTLDSSPDEMSAELAKRIHELPNRVEDYLVGIDLTTYAKRVVARLPEMLRKLESYTRCGTEGDVVIGRCYLPAVAGHNLLIGAELALAEGEGRGTRSDVRTGVRPVAEATSSTSERMQKKTSLRFAREELEAALDMLGHDLGVKIFIRGPDLQADGITRNQLFGIDMSDRTGEEILVEMLRRANPDKTATGPADPRQKLVYVVGPDGILITTRAKVAERGERLPAVFSPSP